MSAVTPTMRSSTAAIPFNVVPKGATTYGPATSGTSLIAPARPARSAMTFELLHQLGPLVVADTDEVRPLAPFQGRHPTAGGGAQHDRPRPRLVPQHVERGHERLHVVAVNLSHRPAERLPH